MRETSFLPVFGLVTQPDTAISDTAARLETTKRDFFMVQTFPFQLASAALCALVYVNVCLIDHISTNNLPPGSFG